MKTEHTVVLQITIERDEITWLLDKGYTLDDIVIYLQGQVPVAIHAYMRAMNGKTNLANSEKPVITIQRQGESIIVIQPEYMSSEHYPIKTLLYNLSQPR